MDGLLHSLAWALRRFPVFGSRDYRFSPSSPKTWRPRLWRAGSGRDSFVADAAGPETFTFKELVPLLASAVGGPSGWCIRLRSWA